MNTPPYQSPKTLTTVNVIVLTVGFLLIGLWTTGTLRNEIRENRDHVDMLVAADAEMKVRDEHMRQEVQAVRSLLEQAAARETGAVRAELQELKTRIDAMPDGKRAPGQPGPSTRPADADH